MTGNASWDRAAPPGPRREEAGAWRRLGPDLFRFSDACEVYAVRSGHEATLIDFGSGDVLAALPDLGVERVNAVLMTHHHRDQGQGLARAVAEHGLPVWVPHTEQDLFAAADDHWAARELRNSYNNRQDRFTPLENVPVAGTLKDHGRLRFGANAFEVVPTPGHTTGSVTLLCEASSDDGGAVRVAFSGDLIAAPGKVWSLAATQWSYNGAEGVAASLASLLDLKERRPDLLLPSHGDPMADPDAAIDLLAERLWRLLRERGDNPRLLTLRERPFEALTPHLLRNRTSLANGYVLLSDDRHALFLDFGYDFVTGMSAGSDRASRRPSLATLPALKRDHGVQRVEVAIPTHFHDDHVAGLNLLREVEGTEVWAADLFADVLERPDRYDLPCLWYDPVPVDRHLPLETPFTWRGHTLTLHALPGHTRYAVAISFEVDGTRVLAIGDQYQGGAEARTNYVYANDFDLDDYRGSAELCRRVAPDLILAGHSDPYRVEPGYLDRLDERGETLARLHRELLPLDRIDLGAQDRAGRLRPYQAVLAGGATASFEADVRNPFARPATATLTLVVPPGWRAEPAVVEVPLSAGASLTVPFRVTPAPAPARRARIALDVAVDGHRFGQTAEALVTVP